jgi:hypothetical protein
VDFYAQKFQETIDEPFKVWRDTQSEWKTQIKNHPEIGGSKLDGVKTSIARLIDGLGDPKLAADFREAMVFTGAGNNPAVVVFMNRLAQRMTEGGHVAGQPAGSRGQRPTAAQAMYPNLPSSG